LERLGVVPALILWSFSKRHDSFPGGQWSVM